MGSEKKISCVVHNIIGSDEGGSNMKWEKVLVATYQNANARKEPRPRIDAKPEKDKEQTENCQQPILLNNTKQDFQNQNAHKVVGIDFRMRILFG